MLVGSKESTAAGAAAERSRATLLSFLSGYLSRRGSCWVRFALVVEVGRHVLLSLSPLERRQAGFQFKCSTGNSSLESWDSIVN